MSTIDLSNLPAPSVIEPLDFEVIFNSNKNDLINAKSELANVLQLESEPLTKLLQEWSYKELLLRQRINEAAKAVMLAYSADDNLDNLVANQNVKRLIIQAADPDAVPPVPEIKESDTDLKTRALLAWDSLSTAGPSGAYIFHALSADPQIKHASVQEPELQLVGNELVSINDIPPGVVKVTVLSREGNGVATADTLQRVDLALKNNDVRPLTDFVLVQAAQIHEYTVSAQVYLYNGPDATVVIAAARHALEKYVSDNHRLGRSITLSGLTAALHQSGVSRVEIIEPTADITNSKAAAAYCTEITITFGGRDE